MDARRNKPNYIQNYVLHKLFLPQSDQQNHEGFLIFNHVSYF